MTAKVPRFIQRHVACHIPTRLAPKRKSAMGRVLKFCHAPIQVVRQRFDAIGSRGGFHVRKHVPADLVSVIGKAQVWRSLGTDSHRLAVRRSHAVIAKIEIMIETARQTLGQGATCASMAPFRKPTPSDIATPFHRSAVMTPLAK
ncbi:DUF6538 domain-containing protein [Novosphingobium organovorum]|uniref:DUF6538 domain-containing protein n=1 Tax=Novosphingobium organovorum TaxID=2930092 RepID=UPI00389915D9